MRVLGISFPNGRIPGRQALVPVRCVFRIPDKDPAAEVGLYEERLTLWQAATVSEAIELAEAEAAEYVAADPPSMSGWLRHFICSIHPQAGERSFR